MCLKGVPGFYQTEDGTWSIHFTAKNSGILIPILSMEGRIQGFQIRLDFVTDSRKYIWLSSSNYHAGYTYSFPEPEDFQKFVNTVLSYSGYDTGVAVADTDHIVTLSTCVNTDRNYRYLVHGKLLKKIQN